MSGTSSHRLGLDGLCTKAATSELVLIYMRRSTKPSILGGRRASLIPTIDDRNNMTIRFTLEHQGSGMAIAPNFKYGVELIPAINLTNTVLAAVLWY